MFNRRLLLILPALLLPFAQACRTPQAQAASPSPAPVGSVPQITRPGLPNITANHGSKCAARL